MTDMKCPICNIPLTACGDLYMCPNDHCAWVGNKELWQELIRTRKALNIATGFIKQVEDGENLDDFGICEDASEALTRITALKQKDK